MCGYKVSMIYTQTNSFCPSDSVGCGGDSQTDHGKSTQASATVRHHGAVPRQV